jgi:hypothetical protein
MPARLFCQKYQKDRIPDAFRFVILYSDNRTRTEDDTDEIEYAVVKLSFSLL